MLPRSVRSFADAFLARGLPLHCLINNAGLGLPHEAHTEDGFETTIGGFNPQQVAGGRLGWMCSGLHRRLSWKLPACAHNCGGRGKVVFAALAYAPIPSCASPAAP